MHVDTGRSDVAVVVTCAGGFFISKHYLVVTEGCLLGLHHSFHGVGVVVVGVQVWVVRD